MRQTCVQGTGCATVISYREQYFIAESLVNRLRHSEYGILDKEGAFHLSYMYYYFLAKFLANNREEHYELIQGLCMDNHVGDNHLAVLFLIHHTSDDAIIDEILVDCLNVLKDLEEATLGKEETSKFEEASAAIPKSILSEKALKRNGADSGKFAIYTSGTGMMKGLTMMRRKKANCESFIKCCVASMC